MTDPRDRDLRDELEFHVDTEQAEQEAAGVPPDVARRNALRDFGSRALVHDRRDRIGRIPGVVLQRLRTAGCLDRRARLYADRRHRTRDEASRAPDRVRSAEARKDFSPEIPIDRISALEEHIRTVRAAPRMSAFMTASLAILTAVLAVVGCIGLRSSLVTESRREIAIRLALGCTRRRLIRGIVVPTLLPYMFGIAMGTVAAHELATRVIATELYRTSSADAYSFIGMPALFVLIGLASTHWPARSAAHTDPAVMLRCE